MRIESIELKRIKPEKTLRAFASCVLTGELNLKLSSIAIHSDGHLSWVTFPKIRTPQGELFFSYTPMDEHTKTLIENAIIEKYEKEVKLWEKESLKHLPS
ncbi:MAG: septation protein SpoVG family protein [Candidatus Saganbacteria bacterium]|nr:septation protein SpoVG family protein [Candidatus Saganbacteria bacterium]